MKKIVKWMVKGFIAFLPIAATAWIIWKVLYGFERFFGSPLRKFLPEGWYWPDPGLGTMAGIAILIVLGYLLDKHRFFQRVYLLFGKLLERIPGVKSIYRAIKNFVQFFDTSKKGEFNKVVMVNFLGGMIRVMGLVTREDFSNLPEGIVGKGEERVAVYFPFSIQMGGFTFFIRKKNVEKLDMPVEKAFPFILTAGVSAGDDSK